ncbi:MAG: transcriptional regulator BetI [Paracoccaceae bacterium]
MDRTPKKTRIKDIRRDELISAAHRVFMIHGLGGMTTARICREAGMSAGILAYYFNGKEDVLFAMVRLNNRILMDDIVARLRRARTRWERLLAIIEGNFPTAVYEVNAANAWLSIVAASASDPRYAQLQRLFYRRLRSNLASVFAGLLPEDRLSHMAYMISVMIDGFWLQKAADEAPDRDSVVAMILTTIMSLLTTDEHQRLQIS